MTEDVSGLINQQMMGNHRESRHIKPPSIGDSFNEFLLVVIASTFFNHRNQNGLIPRDDDILQGLNHIRQSLG